MDVHVRRTKIKFFRWPSSSLDILSVFLKFSVLSKKNNMKNMQNSKILFFRNAFLLSIVWYSLLSFLDYQLTLLFLFEVVILNKFSWENNFWWRMVTLSISSIIHVIDEIPLEFFFLFSNLLSLDCWGRN